MKKTIKAWAVVHFMGEWVSINEYPLKTRKEARMKLKEYCSNVYPYYDINRICRIAITVED